MKHLGKYGNKVLITGSSGFIGSKVVDELLNRGYEVHSLAYDILPTTNKNLIQHKMNLLNSEEIKNFFSNNSFNYLLHLAWYTGEKCHVHNSNIDWFISTLTLLKVFAESGGKVFLGAGSCSEYEYKYGYLTEDFTPTDPQTLYGNSKNAVYNVAKVFCKQNDIDFKWARIFNLYGPNEKSKRLMPSVIRSCLNGEDVKVSDCLKYQDYLYVEDTANAIVDVFESELDNAVNICSGRPVQLRTIVNKIAEFTNFKGNILWGAIPAAFEDEVVVGNNKKLKSIGWSPKYSLDDGLKLTINWWKENNVQ